MNDNVTPSRILVVEDEPDMAHVLQYNLRHLGHEVRHAGTLAAAGEELAQHAFELMLLDLRLPDGSGLDFLRAQADAPPTIVVSALGDEPTVVEALNLGAEDFVTKPFRMKELLARVSGTLRRHTVVQPSASVSPSENIRSGGIVMNFATFEVECDGDLAGLTRSEFRILEHFMKNPDRVLTRKQLCDEALDAGGSVQERTIDAHIRTIRRKLGEHGKRIATVWGVGYRLLDPEDE